MNIPKAEVYTEHVYMLVKTPLQISVLSFMQHWKGKSSTTLYEQFSE